MTRLLAFLTALVAFALFSSGASAVESTIIRGGGIGKVKVGMTRAQVERVLGTDSLVNVRAKVGETPYLELGWDFSTWGVGFVKRRGTYRVAQVTTALSIQRDASGNGVGTSVQDLARTYPQAICLGYYKNMGSRLTPLVGGGFGNRASSYAVVVAGDRKQLAFLIQPGNKWNWNDPWVADEVIVRNSIPGAVDFVPQSSCKEGWRERGTPGR